MGKSCCILLVLQLYLTGFAGFGNKPINNAVFFKGCGGQAPSGLNYLEIQNHKQGSMQMALDGIHLV